MRLQQAGKIRHYGVSNLDLQEMLALWKVPGGASVATNQLLYNLMRRGIEWDLLPWLRERRVPVMAYSPIEQAKLARNKKLIDFAGRHAMTPAQAAIAWLLANDEVIVIPKTGRCERLEENLGALDHALDATQLAELDRLFPPPGGPRPLEML
jgi:diketogulonate reductase-like aldo/keto reductase